MSETQERRKITATEAARLLGLGRTTFYNFVKRHADTIHPIRDERPNLERSAKLYFWYDEIEPFIPPENR